MRQRISLAAFIALASIIPILAGCRTITTQLMPGAMKVGIDIKDYHLGTTQVAIHFSDQSGNTVEFIHGETVTCNGAYLAYDSGYFAHLFGYGAYTGTVPLQPAGGTYTFTYTPAGGTSGAISIPVAVVNAPMQITQPKSGAVVPIPTSVPFTASYTPSGLANTSVYGVASDSRVHVALSFTLSEPGSLAFKTEDFHDFAPGPGNLSLARVTSTAQGNTPFAQVNVSYENIHTIPITWQ
jgi:hypothetical protein